MSANPASAPLESTPASSRPSIELSDDQVAAVLRHADGSPRDAWSLISSGVSDSLLLTDVAAMMDSKKMSQSLFRGLWLMLRLDAAADWTGVGELAEVSSMTPSTVHRYLATLLAFGIVEQHAHSRRYRIKTRR